MLNLVYSLLLPSLLKGDEIELFFIYVGSIQRTTKWSRTYQSRRNLLEACCHDAKAQVLPIVQSVPAVTRAYQHTVRLALIP